jgi:hypothetical protein
MKVLLVKPNKEPEVVEIENSLEAMQQVVGGFIEVTYPDGNAGVLICNEEGKLRGLPFNRDIGHDIIVGDFFICSSDMQGNFISLPDKWIEYYKKMFAL